MKETRFNFPVKLKLSKSEIAKHNRAPISNFLLYAYKKHYSRTAARTQSLTNLLTKITY